MEKSHIRDIVLQSFYEIRQLLIAIQLFTVVPHALEFIYYIL